MELIVSASVIVARTAGRRLMTRRALRKISERLEISLTTAFIWRHKILNALKRMERVHFRGVLEIDETHAQLACRGRISLKQAKLVLDGVLDEVNVLCSDAHGTWKAFAKGEDINHVILNASKKRRVSDIYHIQNVNSFHSRFKAWLLRFNGVASKFLDNDLVWFSFLDTHNRESSICKRDQILAIAFMTPAVETYQTIRSLTFAFPS